MSTSSLFTMIAIIITILPYLCSFHLCKLWPKFMPKKYVKSHSFQIFARTKMPVFDESDEEELNNIINGNQQRLKSNVKPQTQAPPNAVIKQPVILPSIVKPNSDWRSARSDVNRYQSTSYNSKKPPTIKQDDSYFSFTDLDYEDFEQAMREEEAGDMGVTGNKLTPEPIQHSGLMSDDLISKDIWSSLFFSDGSFCDFQKVMRPNSDLLLVLADPRRLNDSFKAMLRQLSQVPVQSLKLSIAAVSCEDVVDLKKYLKKCNYPTNGFSLLSDPTKKFVTELKCRTDNRIATVLVLINPVKLRVLKVWYEGSWDVLQLRDLISEEIDEYRRDAIGYTNR